ncbi:AGAP006152-PA-like protein [Anopheles sinensis]|uniref:AGAP006152-PA-like protein n=1 Tax=Anopheles sinensis TaxID=74873 RepID=A0A084WEM5_ANOSI|nr:AGAP006152-PA-like protein [Anopheles sinensis]
MLCQCQFALLTVLSLVCFAADFCRGSSSEYLIIRHGRSRVRHSSEKDHIRWGLQVFDNFTLLDYDASGGSGSGAVVNDEQTISVPWRGSGAASDSGSSAGNAGGTLTIQFNESEELERMIELSDFDNLRFGAASPGRHGALEPAEQSTMRPAGSAPTTVHPPSKEGKLIKKEIMENIRRTVDKGLEYLKSHRNLDEVKIELVPFRSASKRSHLRRKASHDPEPFDREGNSPMSSSIHRSNRPEEEPFWSTSSSSVQSTPTQSSSDARTSLSERQRNAIDWPESNIGKESEVDVELNPWDDPKRNLRPPPKVAEGQVFASNQRLISLGAIPGRAGDERVALASDTGLPAPGASEQLADPIVIGSKTRLEVEWNGQQVVSSTVQPWPTDGEDYPNDVVEEDHAPDSDRTSTYVELPEGEEGETGNGAQDDDPLLQDAEEIEVIGGDGSEPGAVEVDVTNIFHMEEAELNKLDKTSRLNRRNLMKGRDVVTQFLQIVESQHLLGANCTAGTALNLGEGVVDRYAQDRFRVEAEIAVNRANMLTR